MKYQPSKIDDSNTVFIWLLVVMVFLAGCATGPAPQEKAPMTRQITSIGTQQDAGAISVLIQGNRMLTYSSVKHPMPLSVIFYFPETILDKLTVPRIAENDIIKTIEALQSDGKEQTARVNVVLKQDAAYEVAQADKGLIISFKKKSSEAPPVQIEEIRKEETEIKTDPMSAETPLPVHLRSITAAKLNDGIQLNILADGRIRDYKSFTIDHPARIVFDLIDVQHTTAKEQVIPVNTPWVHQVRYYAYSDRLRIVLETQKKYLTAYLASPLEEGLAVYVGEAKAVPAAGPAAMDSRQAPAAGQTGPAWINRIDFLAENAGRSTLVIGTTRKVNFKIDRAQEKRLLLKLFETRLPDYRKHALITTRFQSAVDRVIPFEQGAPKAAMILVEMREAVPYLVEQVDNLLFLRFEPSKIPPKPLEAARLPSWKQVLRETLAEPEAGKEAAPAGPVATQPDAPSDKAVLPAGPGQKYSGEKIALDFYDTDIKNVFRILREVSGKNFAIEKDVAGKVTLALAKPVPWDQVLDLVLKMNQLGMREEGNIIRIATLKTLDGEALSMQAKVASETKAIEQQQALEPLVTEWIPINYANANKDILPNVEKIMTKDRGGSASVNERTNMIIITDTAEKIQKARDIIRQLDTATPQVMIEARIVEASTTFSRSFGIRWGSGATPTGDPP
ncbi:MAG: AMIN domain-containing protein, partial [Desulfobacterales bacterium]|nr:AMIN domain-containing protein [Desulfobacterales bacterium]